MRQSATEQLQQIPGVGERTAQDLRAIGISRVDQLKGRKPERLYRKLCDFKVGPVDKCMLYIFRCAVYYASTKEHDPNLLKWWNWKDRD